MKCLGCATSFKEGEKLVMQSLHIEYKNYNLPIKDQKPTRTLLKTIVSFLNSQGGSIFIGVQDNKGEVRGVELDQDSRQDFSKFINNLITNIRPDVITNSLIKVQFVPVVGKKQFQNKYLIKIAVKQGEPARIYCFSHKIKIEAGKDAENHEIFYGYFRHNMGGIEELKGLNLLKQIRNRALNPVAAAITFHQGCNPQPLNLQETNYVISIIKVSQEEFKELSQFFKEQLQILSMDFNCVHDGVKSALISKFQDVSEFEKTRCVLKESLEYLNGANNKHHFRIKGEKKREFVLMKLSKLEAKEENQETKEENRKSQVEEKKDKKSEGKKKTTYKKAQPKQVEQRQALKKEKPVEMQKWHGKSKKAAKQQKHHTGHQEKKNQTRTDKSQPVDHKPHVVHHSNRPNLEVTPKKPISHFPKKYSVTLTHLDSRRTKDLVQILKVLLVNIKFQSSIYTNSIELFFLNEEQLQSAQIKIFQNESELLAQYGFKQQGIQWGKNRGFLTIKNYNKDKKTQLQYYCRSVMKHELHNCCFDKLGKNSFCFVMEFIRPDVACRWLDLLLNDFQLKSKFSIPGSKEGIKAKMKIILELENDLYQLANNAEMNEGECDFCC